MVDTLFWKYKGGGLRGKVYVQLARLKDEDLVETKKFPPTPEEMAQYDAWGVPEESLLRTGWIKWRKKAGGTRTPEKEKPRFGLEPLLEGI